MSNIKEISEVMSEKIEGLDMEDILNYPHEIVTNHYKAGTIFIEPGDFCKDLIFIKKGAVRAYHLAEEIGEEKTLYLRVENFYLADHYAVILGIPTILYYECIEDCIFYRFNFDEMQEYMFTNPRVMSSGFKFIMKLVAEFLTRNEDFIYLSPEERYKKFVMHNPEIIKRIPAKYIASLLGITAVSMSRIKKRIVEKANNDC
jgi:CRP-like cAMP-binding protein